MLHVYHYDIESQYSLIDQNWLEFKFLKITGNRINNFKFKSVNLLVRIHLHGRSPPHLPLDMHFYGRERAAVRMEY